MSRFEPVPSRIGTGLDHHVSVTVMVFQPSPAGKLTAAIRGAEVASEPTWRFRFTELCSLGAHAESCNVSNEKRGTAAFRVRRSFENKSQFSLAVFLAEYAHGLGAITRNRLSEEGPNFHWLTRNAQSVVGKRSLFLSARCATSIFVIRTTSLRGPRPRRSSEQTTNLRFHRRREGLSLLLHPTPPADADSR